MVFLFSLALSPVLALLDLLQFDLYSLADLELRQHEAFLGRQNLAPLDPTARAQFRAISYHQISARIVLAVAKASVMRLLGIPRLSIPPLSLVLSLLETALAQQILFPLLFSLLVPCSQKPRRILHFSRR